LSLLCISLSDHFHLRYRGSPYDTYFAGHSNFASFTPESGFQVEATFSCEYVHREKGKSKTEQIVPDDKVYNLHSLSHGPHTPGRLMTRLFVAHEVYSKLLASKSNTGLVSDQSTRQVAFDLLGSVCEQNPSPRYELSSSARWVFHTTDCQMNFFNTRRP
jgi:hypothetical protein